MLAGQVAARREAEMAEFAARYPVPAGVPTDPTMSGLEQMVMACEERPRSVREQLLDEALAAGRGA
jgi:hypothetical protein